MKRKYSFKGFTLVEVLVSITILTAILLVVTSVIGQTQRSWKLASSRLSQFRESRLAFEAVVRNLRQSVIDSQYDYNWQAMINNSTINDPLQSPGIIRLSADLGFVCGAPQNLFPGLGSAADVAGNAILFQAPLGYTGNAINLPLRSLLNSRGYVVQFGNDQNFLPQGLASKLQSKGRYRLLEFRPTAEENNVFVTSGSGSTPPWTSQQVNGNNVGGGSGGSGTGAAGNLVPLAENIVLFVAACAFPNPTASSTVPRFADQPAVMNTVYNSYAPPTGLTPNTLPAGVRITMVSIDETSAARLSIDYGSKSPNLVGRSGASFATPTLLEADLERFGQFLTRERINYRAYSAFVVIPAADQY